MMKEFLNKIQALFDANLGETFTCGEIQYAILRFCGGSELYDLQNGQVVKIDTLKLREVSAIVSRLEEIKDKREKAE